MQRWLGPAGMYNKKQNDMGHISTHHGHPIQKSRPQNAAQGRQYCTDMLGIMSSRPCAQVKVVARAPAASEPCMAPATPASDSISVTCERRQTQRGGDRHLWNWSRVSRGAGRCMHAGRVQFRQSSGAVLRTPALPARPPFTVTPITSMQIRMLKKTSGPHARPPAPRCQTGSCACPRPTGRRTRPWAWRA